MDEKVPYIVFEGEMARHERTIKRLVTLLILTIGLLFVSNMCWLWFFNSFDITSEEVVLDTDTGGANNYIKNGGVITNGEDESQNNDAN